MERIVGQRRQRIAAQGHERGALVPESRQVPLVPFGRDPFLICEIKRRSPSKGWIDEKLDAAAKARELARSQPRRRDPVRLPSVSTPELPRCKPGG